MSELNYFSPEEMAAGARLAACKKISYPAWKTFSLSILGGAYIGFGGMLMLMAGVGAAGVLPFGLTRLLMGLVFSIGLVLVVLGGAELFTGSTIVPLAALDKKASWLAVLRNWFLVYSGNFVGALILDALIILSGRYAFGSNAVGEAMMKLAESKMHYGFVQAVVLGILCNLFVCLGVWLAMAAKSAEGKILAIIFPITLFVAWGFEHSVANMYFLSSAKFLEIAVPSFASSVSLAWPEMIFKNFIPVTIGNIIGGLLIWLPYYFIYKKDNNNQ
jgi:formate/nitrite transporter